jgi:hypothetical protein
VVPPLLLAAVWLAAASVTTSCGSTRACKNNTLLVTVTLDSAAAMADKLVIAVTVGSGTPKMNTLDHTPGQASGTVEIDFPNGYPTGQKVNVGVTATHAGAPVGSGSADSTLSDGCEAVSVSVKGGGGGVGGNGGSGTGGAGVGGIGSGDAGLGGMDGGKIDGGPGMGGTIGADAGPDAMSTDTNKADAGCLAPANTMCGGCYVTTIDRAHCGSSCAVCGAAQVCNNSLCVNAVAPTFVTPLPADPTGWLDPSGAALVITVGDTAYTGAIYECRTGPDASFTTTTPAWGPCDGAGGTGKRHVPTPSTTPGGNYRTEFRYRSDTYVSPVIATRYYVHHGLDKVGLCPRAGVPADGPHFADTDYFAAATTFATANPTLFPLSATFPAGSAIPVRTDAIYLRNPFIKIPFSGVSETIGMSAGQTVGPATFWPTAGGSYVFNERSLRHAWVINSARTMVLLKRRYAHPAGDCREQFWVGQDRKGVPYTRHPIDCEAMVLNTHGNGLCFNGPGATPVPIALDAPPNGAGTVTATVNSATVTGSGTLFSASLVGEFIQIPSGTGRWYKIATVASATSMTISTVYANTTASGIAYRITLSPTYNIPAAYAKMHPDAHNYATGVTAPGTPSPKTKCETLGCDTNKPWLTYLPP